MGLTAGRLLKIGSCLSAAVFFVPRRGPHERRPGEGFFDPTPAVPVGGNPGTTIGQQRINAFLLAAQIWGETIASDVPIFVLANLASGVTSLIPDADLRRPDAIDPTTVVAQIHAHRATRSRSASDSPGCR